MVIKLNNAKRQIRFWLCLVLLSVAAQLAHGELASLQMPLYTGMTNYYVFATNDNAVVSSNEYVVVKFETGETLLSEVVLTTNYLGQAYRALQLASTNEWGRIVTNTINIASLKPKVPQGLVLTADILSFDKDTGWAEAKGHVVVSKGDQILHAVYARVNTDTEDAYAAGNVQLSQPGGLWEGKVLSGNFRTRAWETGETIGSSDPFRIIKSEGSRVQTNGMLVLDATILTTCTNEYPNCHYHLKARKVTIKPGRLLRGWGGSCSFNDVPALYLPYWKLDLRPDFGWTIAPGQDSRLGAYLLSSYRYRMNPVFRGETHVDYMSERGVAFGQDFKWGLTNGIPILGLRNGAGNGDIKTYFINDKKPVDDDEDAATSDIEESRYRILLRNRYSLTARDYTMLNASYVSDTDVLEDFFEDEYRVYHTPDNYFIYGHNENEYSISLSTRFRLNDFYEGVNKLPELSIDFMPQQIGESSFFYEGRTAVANLEQVYAESNTNDLDYSVYRFDTWHEFSRPQKFFGFLNVIPRTSYRGTYYSETYGVSNYVTTVTQILTNNIIDASGVSSSVVSSQTSTNAHSVKYDTGAGYRNVFGLGTEVSFKAFKQWGGEIKPRRHVVEPYLNYTFVPEPNILASELYQFDDVDSQGEANWMRLGLRNKLQKKVKRSLGYSPHDIVDLDLYTAYNLNADDGVDPITDVWMDIEWAPRDDFMVEAEARYDLANAELATFNIRGYASVTNTLRVSLELRYAANSSSLLTGDLSLFPDRVGWNPSIYTRYEIEESRVEEVGFYLRRTYDCLVFRTGVRIIPGYERVDGSQTEDEYRGTFEFWLRAFPEYGMQRRRSSY